MAHADIERQAHIICLREEINFSALDTKQLAELMELARAELRAGIEFHRVQAGHYILTACGVQRPIDIVRDGRTWLVQHVHFLPENRRKHLMAQARRFRTLACAKVYAAQVWDAMQAARAADEEYAIKMNREVVYVEGYGTRAYTITNISEDGVVSIRPLSGGIEWSFDQRRFGTVPFAGPCRCGHEDHFNAQGLHAYGKATAGGREVLHVGPVCDACAKHCMADYLI